MERNFREDVEFLNRHGAGCIVLENAAGARVAVAPRYQGRVMTSSAAGDNGFSCGWINYRLIESGETTPHINAYGGEDRFWLGPEGGQFSIYFAPGAPFDFEHWQVPEVFDTAPWELTGRTPSRVAFRSRFAAVNRSGTPLAVDLKREVTLLDADDVAALLAMELPSGVRLAAYATDNTIGNAGDQCWTRETGALSVWMLGMFKPSDETLIAIPYRAAAAGAVARSDYFGEIPPERFRIDENDRLVLLRADGRHRGKIGLAPERAAGFLGSYDARHRLLTVVTYSSGGSEAPYVNAAWEMQDEPFRGDVVNAYNDGVPGPGLAQMGPFYELESSSPAAFLAPGEQLTHRHATLHFTGSAEQLDPIARRTLGVPIARLMKKI